MIGHCLLGMVVARPPDASMAAPDEDVEGRPSCNEEVA